jgi:hypothetical protein
VRSVIGYSLLTALMIVTPMLCSCRPRCCIARSGTDAARRGDAGAVAGDRLLAYAAPAASPDLQKMAWSYLAGIALAIALPTMAAIPMVERGEPVGRVLLFLLTGAIIGLAVTETASLS